MELIIEFHVEVFSIDSFLKNHAEVPVKESNFSKFTDCFNYVLLFNNSKLKWLYIHRWIALLGNSCWWQNWKGSSKFHINHLLILQICEPNSKPLSRESSYTKYLLIRAITFLIKFHELQKNCFSREFIFANQTKI